MMVYILFYIVHKLDMTRVTTFIVSVGHPKFVRLSKVIILTIKLIIFNLLICPKWLSTF